MEENTSGKIAARNQSVHSKIATWQKKESDGESSESSSSLNYHGMLHMQDLKGKDGHYGCPREGTKTEYRGKQAGVRISNEIVELCMVIKENGYQWSENVYVISFGNLFEIYTKISNKLVGMLMRARKQGLIEFEGEMLFQRRDDAVKIKLIKMPDQLQLDVQKRAEELAHHAKKDS